VYVTRVASVHLCVLGPDITQATHDWLPADVVGFSPVLFQAKHASNQMASRRFAIGSWAGGWYTGKL